MGSVAECHVRAEWAEWKSSGTEQSGGVTEWQSWAMWQIGRAGLSMAKWQIGIAVQSHRVAEVYKVKEWKSCAECQSGRADMN